MHRKLSILLAAVAVLMVGAVPASADPRGFVEVELPVGYFYGTFGESPNTLLFAGGTAEEFCLDNPEDPFAAEPGVGTHRISERESGATVIKANSKGQPIHLYRFDGEAPDLLFATCDALFDGDASTNPLEPFASGVGNLKVRISVLPDGTVDVFNSINGKASATDGAEWKVRAWADLIVVDGMPVGDPPDFVFFEMHQIKG